MESRQMIRVSLMVGTVGTKASLATEELLEEEETLSFQKLYRT